MVFCGSPAAEFGHLNDLGADLVITSVSLDLKLFSDRLSIGMAEKVGVRGLFNVSSQLFVLFVQQAQNAFLSPFIMSAGMDHDGPVVMFIKRDSGIKGAVVGRWAFFCGRSLG